MALLVVLVAGVAAALVYALRPAPTPTPPSNTNGGQGNGADGGQTKKHATPQQVDAVVKAAAKLQQSNEPLQARTILEGAIREFPEEPDLYVALGQLLAQQQDTVGSLSAYEKAIAVVQAGEGAGRTVEPGVKAAMHYGAGVAALQLNDNDKAEEQFAAALAIDDKTAEFHSAMAQVFTRKNKLAEASAELVKAANIEPARGRYWANLAELELRQNRGEVALSYIGKARTAEPRVSSWRLIEARALNRVGRPADALNTLAGLDKGERYQLVVLKLMADSHGLMGRQDLAAEVFQQASDESPQDATLAYEAALAAERAKKPDAARRLARRAADLGHTDAAEMVKRLLMADSPEPK